MCVIWKYWQCNVKRGQRNDDILKRNVKWFWKDDEEETMWRRNDIIQNEERKIEKYIHYWEAMFARNVIILRDAVMILCSPIIFNMIWTVWHGAAVAKRLVRHLAYARVMAYSLLITHLRCCSRWRSARAVMLFQPLVFAPMYVGWRIFVAMTRVFYSLYAIAAPCLW